MVTAAMASVGTIPAALGDRAPSMGPQALLGSMGSQGKTSARAEQGPWLSQLSYFQFKELMKRRKRQDRLGPGTYNIKDFLQETRPTSIRGICDTRDERFRDAHRDCFPGPGTYGNPYIPLDERDKRSASTKGMMDSRTAKCALMEAAGSGLGPGTYSLRSSIGQGLRRAGGPRPCQRVSGRRPKPTSGGCQALEKQKKGSEVVTVTIKSFLDELMSNENKKKGCFSTLPRDPGCPMERIFWFTLSQCPRKNVMGPGSYNPKPIEKSACYNQAPSWSTAKRFDRNFYHLFTGNENPVGAGRYDTSKHEKYPQKIRYQSLYQCEAQRYLSNLKRDAYLLERLKPVAKTNWCDLIAAPRCPDTSEEITFPKVRWCWKAQISE